MKSRKLLWIGIGVGVYAIACGGAIAYSMTKHPQNTGSAFPNNNAVEQTFLSYKLPNKTYGLFPANEAGGAYGTGPYTMQKLGVMVSSDKNMSDTGKLSITSYTETSIEAPSPHTGREVKFIPLNDQAWYVDWTINKMETKYWLFKIKSGQWVIAPTDNTSYYVLSTAYQ